MGSPGLSIASSTYRYPGRPIDRQADLPIGRRVGREADTKRAWADIGGSGPKKPEGTVGRIRPIMNIRRATEADFESIWAIFQAVVSTGTTCLSGDGR